jgi:hypothetical protein
MFTGINGVVSYVGNKINGFKLTLGNLCSDQQMQIISQIITPLHVSTLLCLPQGACNEYLAKLHKYVKCSFGNTECPTRYRTRHFFNNFTTNEDIATKFESDLQTHSSSFLTQRTYSCSNFVAMSSLVLELLMKCLVR